METPTFGIRLYSGVQLYTTSSSGRKGGREGVKFNTFLSFRHMEGQSGQKGHLLILINHLLILINHLLILINHLLILINGMIY